jgi:hypothetical protein
LKSVSTFPNGSQRMRLMAYLLFLSFESWEMLSLMTGICDPRFYLCGYLFAAPL